MEQSLRIKTKEDALHLMAVALQHEWAVSFEYLIHAYSMPKAKYFYEDPVMKKPTDIRAQTIQIGIDEMYHALQLGIIITQMEGTASFKTDEIIRYPRMIDNLIRDKMTEDQVTALYQTAEFSGGAFSRIQNMALNISSDEVRHSRQFEAMIETLRKTGNDEALLLRPNPEVACREEIQLLHELMRSENDLMHRYLRYVILFSEHQDLSARLFKNSVDHMRHWDKLSGILVRLGDVLQIENASRDSQGVERSTNPMPMVYPGHGRREALESLLPSEKELIVKYEQAIGLMPDGDIKGQLHLHLALTREHVFTQEWLLHNARNIPGLEEK